MTVKELIEQLKKLNGDLPVLYFDDKWNCHFEVKSVKTLKNHIDPYRNANIESGVELQ